MISESHALEKLKVKTDSKINQIIYPIEKKISKDSFNDSALICNKKGFVSEMLF